MLKAAIDYLIRAWQRLMANLPEPGVSLDELTDAELDHIQRRYL